MRKVEVKTVNTKTLGINMPKTMFNEIDRRSRTMGISKSKYCKLILCPFIESGEKVKLEG